MKIPAKNSIECFITMTSLKATIAITLFFSVGRHHPHIALILFFYIIVEIFLCVTSGKCLLLTKTNIQLFYESLKGKPIENVIVKSYSRNNNSIINSTPFEPRRITGEDIYRYDDGLMRYYVVDKETFNIMKNVEKYKISTVDVVVVMLKDKRIDLTKFVNVSGIDIDSFDKNFSLKLKLAN